jgi:hypothetical protein
MQEPWSLKRVFVVSLGLLAVGSITSATDVTGQLTFVGIVPCRIIETRGLGWTGQAGPPSLIAGAERTFQMTGTVPGVPTQCGIPDTALAISVNFTVTGFTGQGDLRVFPAGGTLPTASILNYQLENIANATSVPLGPSGGGHNGITVQADGVGTDFIADVNGYYLPQGQGVTSLSGQTGNVTLAGSNGLSVSAGSGTVNVTSNATPTNTASAIVSRDGSGNFSAGTITGNLNGTAASATTAMNFSGSLAGEVTGPQGATVVSNAVPSNTARAVVRRDGAGSFSAGTVTLAGNLALPNTSAGGSVGTITMGSTLFLHNFGVQQTFLGANAGNTIMTGRWNTGVGFQALTSNSTGDGNSAFGLGALDSNTTGGSNSAFGYATLGVNTTGGLNAAFGEAALAKLTSGDSNIAIGQAAGFNLTTGSNNIYIGNFGGTSESQTIRIGSSQTVAFMAGISGTTISGVGVLVSSSGQLGVAASSRRFKDEIADMGRESDVLMKLRPVAFYYKPEYDDTRTRQYGLVAEEVAEVAPELVLSDKDGSPQTVRYHFVNAMLLNEVQKQRRQNEEQKTIIVRQESKIQELEARLARLEAALAGGH